MKKILILIPILFSIFISSQEFKFEEVVKVDSTITKDELFNRARSWIRKDGKTVIFEDNQRGELSASYIYNYRTDEKYKGRSCVEGPVKYNIRIFIKDGKYKYIFSSFDHKGSHGNICRPVNFGIISTSDEAPAQGKGIQYNLGYADLKEKIKSLVAERISSLKSSMLTKYEGRGEW